MLVQAMAKDFLQFHEARENVRQVGLKSKKQWQQWCRDGQRPLDIPSLPSQRYKDKGWVSWADWLGYDKGRSAKRR
jgi:hypothetical protein